MQTVNISRISEEEFLHLRTEWNSLLERSVTNEVFLSWEWIYSWWETFTSENKELFILVGKNDSEELVGIAPFYLESTRYMGLTKKKILRLCSSQETYPDHLDIICDEVHAEIYTEAIMSFFAANKTEWDEVVLEGLKKDSNIRKYLSQRKYHVHDFIIKFLPESECPYLTINQCFEDYFKSFSGKTRNTLLRKRKKLLVNDNVKFGVVSSKKDNPENYMKELFSLHTGRAKRKGLKTVFTGEKIYSFHKNFVTRSSGSNNAVIFFLAKESTFLVLFYCMKYNNKYYYYQAGISEEGELKSAGTILMLLSIEKAFSEGCSEFDFLRGDEQYKYFWAKDSRQNYSLTIQKNNFQNRMANRLSYNLLTPGKKRIKYLAEKLKQSNLFSKRS